MTTRPDVTRFLDAIWADGPHSLCSKTPGGVFRTRGFPASPTELIDQAVEIGPDAHIWWGVCPLIAPLADGRGGKDDVAAVASLFADLDWASPAHKELDLPSEGFVRSAVAELGEFAPSIVVHSGYGLQAYWLLTGAVPPDEGLELQQRMSTLLAGRGLINERVDLASVLRLPGSVNIKIPEHPRLVEIERLELGWRFTPQRLRKYLPEASSFSRGGTGTRHHGSGTPTEEQRLLLDFITAFHGAQLGRIHGGVIEVTRPGKAVVDGISGTIIVGAAGDALLTVFSPNWPMIGCRPGEAARSWVLRDGELVPARDANVLEIELEESMPPPADEGDDLARPPRWTDATVGRAFAEHLGDGWLYVPVWGRWLHWDGRRWADDELEAVHNHARRWVERQLLEATRRDDEWTIKQAVKYLRLSALEAVVKVARRIVAASPASFDRHPHLLNCRNGVVDLRDGELAPHDPTLRLTKMTGAPYEPSARHPDIDAAWSCLRPADAASVRQLLGVAATGFTGPDVVAVFQAGGGNGKTTLLLAGEAALGDYAAPIAPALLMKGRDDHPTIIADLRGRRLAYLEETEEEGGFRLERLKSLSGGGTLKARVMRGDYFDFRPTHTLIVATNHRPVVNSGDHATWRRLRLIPFPYRYGFEPGDLPIDEELRPRVRRPGSAQATAMLAVIVAGAVEAFAIGGDEAPSIVWSDGIEAATREWREQEDVIMRFASSELVFGSDERTTLRAMYARYVSWCKDGGRSEGSDKLFAERFEAHDLSRTITRTNLSGKVGYRGVGLAPATFL